MEIFGRIVLRTGQREVQRDVHGLRIEGIRLKTPLLCRLSRQPDCVTQLYTHHAGPVPSAKVRGSGTEPPHAKEITQTAPLMMWVPSVRTKRLLTVSPHTATIVIAIMADVAFIMQGRMGEGVERGALEMEATAKVEMSPVPLSSKDQRDIEDLYEAIRKGKAKLVGPDGEVKVLPVSLYSFLVELIGLLNAGQCVYIVQNEAKLTTVEAATMLGVSRQFLVNLLEKDEIPYHLVGTHRRIYAHDLLRYKAKRDGQRRKALDELVEVEVNQGLYDKVPPLNED